MNATIEDTLLDLFHQVIEDPDRIPAVPTEDPPEDAGQRRLLTGFRDVLERLQQRQQDRLDTQGRFWLAVQGANDGLWDRHIPSDEYHLSTRWKSMLGYEEHEIADTVDEWRKRIHPDDLDRTLAAGRAYINGETDSYEIEYRLRHKDGSYRWILARGAALRDANGKAYAIENARLYAQAQDLAALEERQKLARELHDSVSQALYGIALGTHAARLGLSRDPEHVAESLDYVLSLAEAGLAEMRALIFELRPESLEKEGLVSALTKQAAAMQARHEIVVSTDVESRYVVPGISFQSLIKSYLVAAIGSGSHCTLPREGGSG